MIDEKVFVYNDMDGHTYVFPCRNREELVAIYEAAATHVLNSRLNNRFPRHYGGDSVTQKDIDACTSERARKMLEVEMREQQNHDSNDVEEVERIKNQIAGIKAGSSLAEIEFIENMEGYEIRLGANRHEGGTMVIQKPGEHTF